MIRRKTSLMGFVNIEVLSLHPIEVCQDTVKEQVCCSGRGG